MGSSHHPVPASSWYRPKTGSDRIHIADRVWRSRQTGSKRPRRNQNTCVQPNELPQPSICTPFPACAPSICPTPCHSNNLAQLPPSKFPAMEVASELKKHASTTRTTSDSQHLGRIGRLSNRCETIPDSTLSYTETYSIMNFSSIKTGTIQILNF